MKKITTALFIMSPWMVFAQERVTDANSLFDKLTDLGNMAIWLLIGLAVVFIVWNSVLFIIHAADDTNRAKYRSAILWGIVGLFIIMSIWGLVAILSNTFGTYNEDHAAGFSKDVDSLILK